MLEQICKTLHQYRNYRRTVRELEKMTDRELQDIGITRYDIENLARETAYGS